MLDGPNQAIFDVLHTFAIRGSIGESVAHMQQQAGCPLPGPTIAVYAGLCPGSLIAPPRYEKHPDIITSACDDWKANQ